jgi:hypothetical protein
VPVRKDTTRYEIDKLAQTAGRFFDYCPHDAAENALLSFGKIAR